MAAPDQLTAVKIGFFQFSSCNFHHICIILLILLLLCSEYEFLSNTGNNVNIITLLYIFYNHGLSWIDHFILM